MLFAGPGVDVRRLWVLVMHLPQGNMTGGQWPIRDQLLATVAELVDANVRILAKVNSKKGTPDPDPLRIEWPGRRDRKAKAATKTDIKAFFSGKTRVVQKGP